MMHKEFHVLSSDGTSSYRVIFAYDGNNLRVKCDCKAGSMGQACRHKESLLFGDDSVLVEKEDLSGVLSWVLASPVQQAISNLREAEIRAKAAHAVEKSAKKILADMLNGK